MPVSARALIQRVTDTLYAPFRYSGSGIPEGTQISDPGWIYRDTDNGILWYKKTGTSSTGWKAMPGTLVVDTTQTGNIGGGEDTLQTYTLPGGTLPANGDSVRIQVSGTLAANSNTKTIDITFAGTSLLSYGTPSSTDLEWVLSVTVIRTGATSYKANATIATKGSVINAEYTAGTATFASDITVLVTGSSDASATNDVVKETFQAELIPAP